VLRLNSAADLPKSAEPLKYLPKFLVLLTLLSACGDEKVVTPGPGDAYFPLEKGIFQVYTVKEVLYSVAENPVQLNYELQCEVVDSFPSGNGEYTYVVHRSIRPGEGDEWEMLDTWSVRKNQREIVVSEGNTAFVKIRFPLRPENVWDGNVFNSMGEDEYSLKGIHQPAEVNGMTFENTLTVEQELNEDPIVFHDERTEVYAMNVGLVYKKTVQLNYCTADACLGQQKVDEGRELQMLIKEYGKR